jgi:hypothetical protein
MSPIKNNPKNYINMEKLTIHTIGDYIQQESSQIVESAKKLARDHSEINLPNASQDDLLVYIGSIRNSFLNLWSHIETQFLDAASIEKMGSIEMDNMELMNKMRDDEYRTSRQRLDDVDSKIQKMDDSVNWKLFAIQMVLFGFLTIFESYLNSSFLQLLNGITLDEARVIGTVLYAFVFLAVLWFTKKVEDTVSPHLRAFYRVLYFLFVGGFIVFTSYMRTMYSQDSFDWMTFLGLLSINALVFIGLLKMKENFIGLKKINEMLKLHKLKKERKHIEDTIERLKSEMKQQVVSNKNLVKDVQSQTILLEKNRKFLESQYMIAISTYSDMNIRLRSDRLVPKCLSNIPPLFQ